MTVTEEKLDEMLKELEDINKSIASPSSSSSDDENGNSEFMTSIEVLFALFVWEAINQYCNYVIHTQPLYALTVVYYASLEQGRCLTDVFVTKEIKLIILML